MNFIFMRHGEARDNVKEIISDKEIYWSTLTKKGIETTIKSVEKLNKTIDKIYVSPLPRTIQTANILLKNNPKVEVIIEENIREIYHGKYTNNKNNEELDNVRIKQINGDYFTRLGEYGENKFDIEYRLCNFLLNVYNNNFNYNTIAVVSHGSVISYIKRILGIKSPHINTGKIEVFEDVKSDFILKHIKWLNELKASEIKGKLKLVDNINVGEFLKKSLNTLIKKEFNNIEFSNEVFLNYINGLKTNKLKKTSRCFFDKSIILICFYDNVAHFIKKWMSHYINLGIKNYVLINNNSTDNSIKIINKYKNKVNIETWEINDTYNCYKMCGWRQQLFEHYGINQKYLTVDSDELLVYKQYKTLSFEEYVNKQKTRYIKSIMLDVYSKEGLYKGEFNDFKYIDNGTYKINENFPYGARYYGGPRSRKFGINPSLQKISFINYSGKELFINDHFYYPWNINFKSKFCAYLLHYKFLEGDKEKYRLFAQDGRHWNNSREYKVYNDKSKNEISFFDKKYSISIEDIEYLYK